MFFLFPIPILCFFCLAIKSISNLSHLPFFVSFFYHPFQGISHPDFSCQLFMGYIIEATINAALLVAWHCKNIADCRLVLDRPEEYKFCYTTSTP